MAKNKQRMEAMDAPLYRYWRAFYMALYSRRLYVDVMKRWRGYGLSYFFLIMMVAVIPLTAKTIADLNQFFDDQLILPFISLPVVRVIHGEVVFDKPMPYFVKNKAGSVLAIIDTTGQVKGMSSAYPYLVILITKNKFFFREPQLPAFFKKPIIPTSNVGPRVQVEPLDQIDYSVFNGQEWIANSDVMKLKWYLLGLVYPTLVFSLFALFACLIFVLAMLGEVFSLIIFKFKLKVKQASRIMFVSSGTPLCLFLIALGSKVTWPWLGYAFIVIIPAYFSFAILAIRRESKQLVFS